MILEQMFKPRNQSGSMNVGTLDAILRGMMSGTSSGISVTPESALRTSAVYACVKVISETVAQLPLILYKRRPDGGKDRATTHPLYNLLGLKPNNLQTSFSFREMNTAHTCLRGDAVSIISRVGNGRIGELTPIHPDLVSIDLSPLGERIYTVRGQNAASKVYAQDDVLHLMGMTLNGWHGVSPITYAREAIAMSLATEKFGGKLFANGAKMSGILTYPGRFKDKETAGKVGRAFDEAASGDNAHSTIVLEEGMKWDKVSMTSEDSQFLQTRGFQIPEIARFFRVPLHKIQELTRATFSNIEQQALEFLTDCLMPWLVRWEQSLNTQLLTPIEQTEYYFEFLLDGLLRGDTTNRYVAYGRAIKDGWMTRNEARIRENMNADNKDLDEFLVPLNMGKPGQEDANAVATQ